MTTRKSGSDRRMDHNRRWIRGGSNGNGFTSRYRLIVHSKIPPAMRIEIFLPTEILLATEKRLSKFLTTLCFPSKKKTRASTQNGNLFQTTLCFPTKKRPGLPHKMEMCSTSNENQILV